MNERSQPVGVAPPAAEAEPDLRAKVAWLRDPQAYPEPPARIESVETHMSWVFLTERHAYKMKKPVRYEYLDFSTLEAREKNCREELRLNRRLAPDVYLGVTALAVDAHGQARVEGGGRVVEWLVKMRRLPAGCMLDAVVRQHALEREDVRAVAALLAGFYSESPPVPVSAQEYRQDYERKIEINRDVLAAHADGLPGGLVAAVHADQLLYIRNSPEAFDRRVREGRIVEGHGDLRPEHICLEGPPVIFDRLEFNRQFRIVDAADELASLAMECERLGVPWVGEGLFDVYADITGDRPPSALVRFYMTYRACLRARLAILHTRELERAGWPKWETLTADYLRLAGEIVNRDS